MVTLHLCNANKCQHMSVSYTHNEIHVLNTALDWKFMDMSVWKYSQWRIEWQLWIVSVRTCQSVNTHNVKMLWIRSTHDHHYMNIIKFTVYISHTVLCILCTTWYTFRSYGNILHILSHMIFALRFNDHILHILAITRYTFRSYDHMLQYYQSHDTHSIPMVTFCTYCQLHNTHSGPVIIFYNTINYMIHIHVL